MNGLREEVVAHALLGEEAAKFAESDLGRMLFGMADQEIAAAQLSLEAVKANDATQIQELQNHIWRARHFKEWLLELIEKGDQALKLYQHEEQRHEP